MVSACLGGVGDGGEDAHFRFELREHLVEILFEARPLQEVEDAPREKEGHHLLRREVNGCVSRARRDPPHFAAVHGLFVERLAGGLQRLEITERGARADGEALGDVVERRAAPAIEERAHAHQAGRGSVAGGCVERRGRFRGFHGDLPGPVLSEVGLILFGTEQIGSGVEPVHLRSDHHDCQEVGSGP